MGILFEYVKALPAPSAVIALPDPNAPILNSAGALPVKDPLRGNSLRGDFATAIRREQPFDRNRRVSARMFEIPLRSWPLVGAFRAAGRRTRRALDLETSGGVTDIDVYAENVDPSSGS